MIFQFVQFGVVALAFSRGGRFERNYALIFLAYAVVFQLSQQALVGPWRAATVGVIDAANLCAVGWLFWRHRGLWPGVLLASHAVGLPLNLIWFLGQARESGPLHWAIWWCNSLCAYGQLAAIAALVLRRDFGPPYRVPARFRAGAAQAAAATSSEAAGVVASGLAASAQPRRRASR